MRIVGGSARGRKIDAPEGLNTRPTLDRVRESIFGSLQFDIPGAEVLDLFGGSGAMGLEALSRGAARAVFNDADAASVRLITANAEKLGFLDRCRILQKDYIACLKFCADRGERFDFIFLDPPYGKGFDDRAVELILSLGLLKEDGKILAEHATERTQPYPARLLQRKKYGKASVSFLCGEPAEPSGGEGTKQDR